MILMNEKQKKEFKELNKLLLDSVTKKEIDYYSQKIHQLLDEAEQQNPMEKRRFNDEQLKLYKEYKHQMLESDSIEDIHYYENKLMELIDESEKIQK